MAIRESFGVGEWYHCYNRGVDKRRVFESRRDYERFLQALYLCNSDEPIHQNNLGKLSHQMILAETRGSPLVSIGAYCLMPNHFHLVLQEIIENGITAFMQQVGTAYTMYFNIKNERTGNLFLKPFRAKRITHDAYFKHIPNYVHLNPAELFEPAWKRGIVKDVHELERKLRTYGYSSFPDFSGADRAERAILDASTRELFEKNVDMSQLIEDATEYHNKMAL